MQKARFLTAFWALAKPYWASQLHAHSDSLRRGQFRRALVAAKGFGLLIAVIGLSLALVWLSVQFNLWNKDFYDTFEKKDQAQFFRQLWRFTYLAFLWIIAGVYRLYLQQ